LRARARFAVQRFLKENKCGLQPHRSLTPARWSTQSLVSPLAGRDRAGTAGRPGTELRCVFWRGRTGGPVGFLSRRQRSHWRRSGLDDERGRPLERWQPIRLRTSFGSPIQVFPGLGRVPTPRGARHPRLPDLPRPGSGAAAVSLAVSSR